MFTEMELLFLLSLCFDNSRQCRTKLYITCDNTQLEVAVRVGFTVELNITLMFSWIFMRFVDYEETEECRQPYA